ncbi:hypothetical protein ZWY2020_045414 [Hordeum vulgare]|nr:hypothetical protein ZWY2020_045414 [Hordeum vulgare]
MGATESKPKPPAAILAPKVFDFPPAAARTRMSTPAYDLMFGKLSLRALFDDYFQRHPDRNVEAGLVFKPPVYDADVDLTATMSKDGGEALMRWQRDSDDPHNFLEVLASTSKSMLRLSSAAHYPIIGIGAFGTFPLLMANRACSEDYGVMGLRYVSQNVSIGASFLPFPFPGEVPYGAWLVGRKGNFSAGLQYKPLSGSNHPMPFTDVKNWNAAVSYGIGSTSPLDNSILFALELVRNTQVYQWRGDDRITGCLSYLDFGLELATRVNEDKTTDNVDKSLFQIAASWQVNKNFLVKGKADPSKSSAALALKLPPCFTFSITVENDHSKGTRSYGFGIHAGDDVIDPRVHRTINSDWTVLTETEEKFNGEQEKRTFQFDRDSGNFENLPTVLKPVDEIL